MRILRICKGFVSAVLAMLLLVTLALPGFAAGRIDLSKEGSLTISYQDEKKPLTGVRFDLYLVATVDTYGNLSVTERFKKYNINLHAGGDVAWRGQLLLLEGYVLRDDLQADLSGVTDQNGTVTFSNPKKGLYLVLGEGHTQDDTIYEPTSFLLRYPSQEEGSIAWNYDVTAYPKFESRPLPPPPPPPPYDPPYDPPFDPPSDPDDTIKRKVLKIWRDRGHETERPSYIEIQLLRNGKVYDTVKLNEKNNWRYKWDELDDDYRWTVVEKEVEDYKVSMEKRGTTFVVTNTYDGDPLPPPKKPKDPQLPQTGLLWWPVIPLTAGGLLLLAVGLYYRKTDDEHD